MSTRLKEREERVRLIFERLIEESSNGKPIIVEGKRDVEALRAIGVSGKVVSAKTRGRSLIDVISDVEKSETGEVILLFDFDRRGAELVRLLKHHLERAKVKSNITFWSELSKLIGKEVKDIEGLATYMETLKRKIGHK